MVAKWANGGSQSSLPTVIFSQSKLTKLNHEHRDLKEKLKEERKQVEELWKAKTELEDERRLQDRTVEQLQRKVRVDPDYFLGPMGKVSIFSEPHET